MTVRQTLALLTIVLVLVLQFAVPILQLPTSTPQRWGWQMYSRLPADVDFTVTESSGAEQSVSLDNHLYWVRWDLRLTPAVLGEYCRRRPDTASLQVTYLDSGEVVLHECSD